MIALVILCCSDLRAAATRTFLFGRSGSVYACAFVCVCVGGGLATR